METSYDCILDVVLQDVTEESAEFVQALLARVLHHYHIPKTRNSINYLKELFSHVSQVKANYPTHILLGYIVVQEKEVQTLIIDSLAHNPTKSNFFSNEWVPFLRKKIEQYEEFIDRKNVVRLSKLLAHNIRESWITQEIPNIPQA